jgi:hypothetical protein
MKLRSPVDGLRLFSAQMPRIDWLLTIILLAALAIRLWSVAFGLPALTDPAPRRGLRVRGWRPPGAEGRPLSLSSLMRSLYIRPDGSSPLQNP